jgi:hypothetical protein
MFFGNSIPASVYASQNLTVFGNDPTLYRNFLLDPQINGPVLSSSRIGPDLVFSRPTLASFWNSLSTINYVSNNVPRFSFHKGQPLGLQIEEQRANLIPYSTNFSNTVSWEITRNNVIDFGLVPSLSVVPNEIQAPDGTNTGSLLKENIGQGFHTLTWKQGTEVLDKVLYSRSIYVKKETARYLVISCANTPFEVNVSRIFDFNLPGFVSGFLIGTSFEDVGNGWYKLIIDRVASNNNTNKLCIGIVPSSNLADVQYSPNPLSLSGVYIWGAQVERGQFSSSYIPTSGSSVIRAADDLSISRPQFKKIYNIKEGTFYIQASRQSLAVNTPLATVLGDVTQYWTLNTNSLVLSTLVGNLDPIITIENIPPIINLTPNLSFRLAIGLKRNESVIYQNQTLIRNLTSIRLPTIQNKFEIGGFFNTKYLNGNIQTFGYWPRRFPNNVIANLNGQSNAV